MKRGKMTVHSFFILYQLYPQRVLPRFQMYIFVLYPDPSRPPFSIHQKNTFPIYHASKKLSFRQYILFTTHNTDHCMYIYFVLLQRKTIVGWRRTVSIVLGPCWIFLSKQSQNRQKRSGDHILLRIGLKCFLASGGSPPLIRKLKVEVHNVTSEFRFDPQFPSYLQLFMFLDTFESLVTPLRQVWKFQIATNHLHVKAVLMRYHLSIYIQEFRRQIVTKEKTSGLLYIQRCDLCERRKQTLGKIFKGPNRQ